MAQVGQERRIVMMKEYFCQRSRPGRQGCSVETAVFAFEGCFLAVKQPLQLQLLFVVANSWD